MQPEYIVLIALAVILALLIPLFVGFSKICQIRPFGGKGALGEIAISSILKTCAEPCDKIIDDILLYNAENGRSSQIDHIFICKNGVFVIETKNYSGTLYGDDRQQEWRLVHENGEVQFRHSPVKQNATHTYLVQKIVGDDIPVHGLVVFVHGNITHVQSNYVYTPDTLPDAFRLFGAQSPLTPETISEVYERILKYRESFPVSRWEHLENISKTRAALNANICPRCGGNLVLRKGKYGQFYGCSNYPKCKFTKQL